MTASSNAQTLTKGYKKHGETGKYENTKEKKENFSTSPPPKEKDL